MKNVVAYNEYGREKHEPVHMLPTFECVIFSKAEKSHQLLVLAKTIAPIIGSENGSPVNHDHATA